MCAKWAIDKELKNLKFEIPLADLLKERERHLATARQEREDMNRGINSFRFAGKIKKELQAAGATPIDIGMTKEELDSLEERLLKEGREMMESIRRINDGKLMLEKLICLADDIKEGGYQPEQFSTTADEIKTLKERFGKEVDEGREKETRAFR